MVFEALPAMDAPVVLLHGCQAVLGGIIIFVCVVWVDCVEMGLRKRPGAGAGVRMGQGCRQRTHDATCDIRIGKLQKARGGMPWRVLAPSRKGGALAGRNRKPSGSCHDSWGRVLELVCAPPSRLSLCGACAYKKCVRETQSTSSLQRFPCRPPRDITAPQQLAKPPLHPNQPSTFLAQQAPCLPSKQSVVGACKSRRRQSNGAQPLPPSRAQLQGHICRSALRRC